MLIGLSGLKGSGKDTVGAYLVKKHEFKRLAWADPLKDSAAACLGIPRELIDNYKNNPNIVVTIAKWSDAISSDPVDFPAPIPMHTITFRQYLQLFGTEGHRDVFGENFWIDRTLPMGTYVGRKIVVTDCRFENEFERIRDLGGFIVEVERPGLVSDGHASEEIPVADVEIQNDGDFNKLYAAIEEVLERWSTVTLHKS